ncbi:solute carrier family 40 protein member 1-like isoform X2 [Marmota marmota marmota]|uniref:solute carrier family 40 protein member 1-like isoform X2 n=1 Tax=Marmota marmota marmota TaxID=9994 RepID=UPI002092594C|nr:solute carrier family 40 protein member 1-like isoform X2 [Marmota marmota marmota]
MSPSPSALTYHPRRAPARAYCAGRSRVAETAGLSFDNPQDTFAPPALSAQSGACSNPHVWFRSRWLRCFIIHLSLRLLESPVRDPDPPAVCSHVVIMVGELNDIENPGNEEKQTKTASTKHMKGETSSLGAILIYLMGPRFLIYVSCALSIWGDQMWHFAMSVFLIELYGHNLLLTAVFGLVVAGSVLIFGVLIGDWIDRKPRNKGGLLHSADHPGSCGEPGWHSTDHHHSEGLDCEPHRWQWKPAGWDECSSPAAGPDHQYICSPVCGPGEIDSWETSDGFINKPGTSKEPKDCRSHLEGQWVTTKRFLLCLRNTQRLLHTCREGWETYCRQTIFLPGLGLAFLYMTVLGFDCITTGYAYTQGIGGFLLSILTALSALSGLMGTILFTWLRGHYGLVTTGVISSWLHVGCLTLCVFSVFAPGSPFDTAVSSLPLSKNSSSSPKLLKDDQVHIYPFERNLNQPILPDRSSIHWTNSTVLFDGQQDLEQPESYVSIILLFSGVILARIGLWSFDLTVTQLLQENIPEAERGAVNGVQCSLNYLMDLIHFILVMLAPQPQQFGMLVFISMLFVTTGHVLYFFYARKCKIENSQVNETIKKGTWTPLS